IDLLPDQPVSKSGFSVVHRRRDGLLDWAGWPRVRFLAYDVAAGWDWHRSALCAYRQGLERCNYIGYGFPVFSLQSNKGRQIVLCLFAIACVGGLLEKIQNGSHLLRVLVGPLAAGKSGVYGDARQAAPRESPFRFCASSRVVTSRRFDARQRGIQA